MKSLDCSKPVASFKTCIFSFFTSFAVFLSNSYIALAETESPNRASSIAGSASISANPAPAAPSSKPTDWRYLNEQEWIVDAIGRDTAEVLGFAKFGKAFLKSDLSFSTKTQNLDSNTYKYSLTFGKQGKPIEYSFALTDYAWSPRAYEPFAKKILQSLYLEVSKPSSIPDDFLLSLSKAEFKYLFIENERISQGLSRNPLDASLHEQAALLLGVFASLQLCGSYMDERAILSRMGAHLALANALNNEKLSSIGEMADSILNSLLGRKKVALDEVLKLMNESHTAVEKSVLRALKIQIDYDPRAFNETESTPLEELLYCKFYAQSRPVEETMKRFEKRLNPLTQPWRRMLSAAAPTVASSSLIAAGMVDAEISDFIECRKAYKHLQDDNFASFSSELNLQPSGCLSGRGDAQALNALGWELVCAFFQRQLAYAFIIEYQYYKWSIANDDKASEVKSDAFKRFSNLDLIPFAAVRFSLSGDEKKSVYDSIHRLLSENPQEVSSFCWKSTVKMAAKNGHTLSPRPESWFDPVMPLGTVFIDRADMENCPKSLAFLDRLRALHPYNAWLAVAWAREKYGEFPTADQFREAFGPTAEYDVQAMRCVCRGEIPNRERFIALAEKIAKEDPDVYFDVADYCVINNMPKKAVEFYEKAFKASRDAIAVANKSDWLVQYFYAIGEKQKAEELAQSAASVYSRRGLQALGRLYEKQGKLSDAEKVYKKIQDRYNNESALLAFYLRHKTTQPDYQQGANNLLPNVFPSGLQKITLAECSGEPTRGVYVQSSWWISDSPLKWYTVIVGINGYLVTSVAQYDVAKDLTEQDGCAVIYWDGKQYKERIEPTIHLKNIGFSLAGYKKAK